MQDSIFPAIILLVVGVVVGWLGGLFCYAWRVARVSGSAPDRIKWFRNRALGFLGAGGFLSLLGGIVLLQWLGIVGRVEPQSSDQSDDGWLGSLSLVAFGVLAFCFYFRGLRLRRLIETIPTSKCRSIAMGLVEVAGQAAGGEAFVSSFTGLPCYISRSTVEQESGDEWRKIHDEERSVSFCVKDDTGSVLVDPAGADLDHIHELHYDFEGSLRAPPGVLERMRLAGVTADTLKRALEPISQQKNTRKLRLCQKMIRPGDPVYVLGSAEERPGGMDEHERIVIRKGKFHPWFVVASGSQKDVLAGLKLPLIWLLVSVTMILGGLWMLLEGV